MSVDNRKKEAEGREPQPRNGRGMKEISGEALVLQQLEANGNEVRSSAISLGPRGIVSQGARGGSSRFQEEAPGPGRPWRAAEPARAPRDIKPRRPALPDPRSG